MVDRLAEGSKIFAGPRIRRLRRELGLTQVRMAEELGISTSYLNLIERNQRPLTAQLLLRLAETYDIDLKTLGGDEEQQAIAELQEVFSDPLMAGAEVQAQELNDIAAASPAAANAIGRLYRAYQEALTGTSDLAERFADRDTEQTQAGGALSFPVEEVRDHFHAKRNHFPEIDERAEELHQKIGMDGDDPYFAMRQHLQDQHGIQVRIMPVEVMSASLRRYDRHRRTIFLSERLPHPGRVFQLANRIASLEFMEPVNSEVKEADLKQEGAPALFRVGLMNYAAAAMIMPYNRFLSAARELRYDVEGLGARFASGFEQTAHRLTTLQKPGARGVPFFLIRVDAAGNVSKRFSAGGFHFARSGGTCPRWNLFEAFRVPGQIYKQVVRMPDDTTYFSIARTVDRVGGDPKIPNQQLVIGLGCELSYANRLVYADDLPADATDKATPIGVNCRLCERPDCTQRAFPPLKRKLQIHDHVRGVSPFTFSMD